MEAIAAHMPASTPDKGFPIPDFYRSMTGTSIPGPIPRRAHTGGLISGYSMVGIMIVFCASTVVELSIGAMSISRYGVMTVYRSIISDLMTEIV